MTRILLAVLILAHSAIGQIVLPQNQQWTGANGFGSGAPPGTSSSASPSYIFQQDFESAGTPSGWTSGGGNVTFHNTSSPLEGTGDLLLGAPSATSYGYVTYSAQTEVWEVFKFQCTALPSTSCNMVGLDNSGFTVSFAAVQLNGSGQAKLFVGGTLIATTSGTISANTLYYCWFHWKNGGAGAVTASFGMGTTTTEVTSGTLYVSTTTGTASGTEIISEFDNTTGTGGNFHFDHIRASTTDLGNFGNWP